MLQHIVYSLANRQGLLEQATTKFMVVVTLLFNPVISSLSDNMFYHAWTTLLIYHDGSNNVYKSVCSSSHEQPVPTCMNKPVNNHVQAVTSSTMFKLASSTMFKPVNNHVQDCQQAKTSYAFYVCILRGEFFICYVTCAQNWFLLIVSTFIGIEIFLSFDMFLKPHMYLKGLLIVWATQ